MNFDNPHVSPSSPRKGNAVTRWIGDVGLKLMGWKVAGRMPDVPKVVLIGAPHTSNWDALAATFSMLKRLEDTQVAYTLLRQCASFGKMVYAARTVPPEFHRDALAEYDASVQEAFGEITGIRKGGDTWLQASLSIKRGGLGLRPTALHADASYLS